MEQKYISVSEYAKFIGKTTTHVYDLVKQGIVPSMRFKRGKMDGILLPEPEGYKEWVNSTK